MNPLPPLECLRFFDAAARHQSFVRAAGELDVTAAAVAYRVRMLEDHIGEQFFKRKGRGVTLTSRGKAWHGEVRRILTDIEELFERNRYDPPTPRLRIVAVELIAERWLLPRLTRFTAARPDIAVEIETEHAGVDPNRHDFDAWITFIWRHQGARHGIRAPRSPVRGDPDAGMQPGAAQEPGPAPCDPSSCTAGR